MSNLEKNKNQLLKEIGALKARILELESSKDDHSSSHTASSIEYDELFEKSEEAMLTIRNGKFAGCNQASINLLRLDNKAELINKHPAEISPKKQPNGESSLFMAERLMEKALKKGSHRFEWNHKTSNGEILPLEVMLTVISDSQKNKLLHTVWRDITKRKNTESALTKSEAKFKQLFDNLSDAVYLTRLRGENSGDILEVNSAALIQTGYSREELLKMNIASDLYISGTAENKTTNWESKLIAGERVCSIEKKKRKDGSEFWTEVTITPLELSGELFGLSINHDITIRKKAQDELKESEKHFRTIFENSSLGFYRITPDGEILFGNPTLFEILGYRNFNELSKINQKSGGFDTFLSRANFFKRIEKKDYVKGFESAWRKKNGELIYLRENAKIFRNQDGKIKYYEGTVEDISEKKHAEQLSKESEERYRTLIENIQDGVFLLRDGKIIFANEAFAKIFGYSAKEVIGENFKKFIAPEYLKKVLTNYKMRMKGESSPIHYEIRALHKDLQSQVYINMTVNRINYENTPVALGTVKDISEDKKTQEIISRKEKYYRTLFDLSPSGIIVTDTRGTILEVNESYCTNNGYTAVELQGKNMCELLPRDKHKEFHQNIQEILKGKTIRQEVLNLSKDGYLRPHEIYEKKVILPDGQAGILSIANNIVERKKIEKTLINALDRATESDQLKSAFLTTMSHELRTPLNAIIGFSDIINDELSIIEILEFNQTINSSGKHLLSIVEDIFDITLVETGEIMIVNEYLKLLPILNDIQSIIQLEQQKTNKNTLVLNLIVPPGGNDIVIYSDRARLTQILANLLKNAIKFTDEGSINYGFDFDTEGNQDILKFFVEDTGIGVAKDKHEVIFDVFRQVEDTHARRFGGTGIGLYIARKLTELLGGKIWLESEIGKGSTFYFTIPYDGKQLDYKKESALSEKVLNDELENKIVLIVEDDEASYEFLKMLFESSYFTTIWAKNGHEAIQLCKGNPGIDLVLMDINMPHMNGYDATIEIKRIRPDLPIIAQTAYAISGDKGKAIEVGCDDYLTKPIKKPILIELVNKYLR